MFKLSNKLTPYCIVQKRGRLIVRAGERTKCPLGVWYPYPEVITVKTLLLNGETHKVSMDVPAGIRYYGPSECLMDLQPKETK